MHIATVIPIQRGIPFDTLTYYASEALLPGTLVAIPLGKQTIYGAIVDTIPLLEGKASIKGAAFSLKKIKAVVGNATYFSALIEAAKDTAALTLSPVGAVAANTIPSTLFDYISSEKMIELLEPSPASENEPVFTERALAGTRMDRVDHYKRLVRTSFAAHQSVLFITPTIKNLERWKASLEKGIGRHIVIFHSKVTKKDLRSHFALLKQKETPLLIFATPAFLGIPRSDIGTIIVEDESQSLYKTNDRFETDLRIFFGRFAEHINAQLVWGDTIPRFETLVRCNADHLPRSFVPDKLHIVPVDHYRTILPSEVQDLIRHAMQKKKRLFIYTNRKGVAPISRCADCGTIVTCPACTLPMVLRNKVTAEGRERYFMCTHCATQLPSTHTCVHCANWNITPVSVGTESIRDAVVALVGTDHVITIDDDLTPDSVTIEALFTSIQKQKFAIVIGTQKAFPYLERINYCILPFFDRALSTPSLYTVEQALRLVMECNEYASDGVIICTKSPDFPTIRQLETQKVNAIIHDELELRRELGYPPFGTIIKLSLTIPEGHRANIVGQIEHYLRELDSTALPPRRITLSSMKVLLVWIIKTNASYIEEEGPDLAQFLDKLRFPYKIEQNPERL